MTLGRRSVVDEVIRRRFAGVVHTDESRPGKGIDDVLQRDTGLVVEERVVEAEPDATPPPPLASTRQTPSFGRNFKNSCGHFRRST